MKLQHYFLNIFVVLAMLLSPISSIIPVKAAVINNPKLPAEGIYSLPGYAVDQQLAVRNQASMILPSGYTVRYVLDTASLISANHMLSNCDDLRITFNDGITETELDRILENCNSTTTNVLFRTQAQIAVGEIDSRYHLNYYNPSAGIPPAAPGNVYTFVDDFQDGNADGWTAAKGTWGVVDDGGNYIYRYTSGGANWAISYFSLPGVSNLEILSKIRAATSTNWIGSALRIQDPNNFLTFYQSRDGNMMKYARVINDVHEPVLATAAFTMPADTWYSIRVQAVGSQVRARIWPAGTSEPALWLIQSTDTTYQTQTNIGATLYFHDTNADWDDFQVRKLVDVEPIVENYVPVPPITDWYYRAQITVANTSPSVTLPVNYTSQLVVDTSALITAGLMLGTCEDLKVGSVQGTDVYEIDRVVDNCNSTNTRVWFALQRPILPSGNDNGYYLYYGDPTPEPPLANETNIFIFYEDWEKGTTHWTSAGGLDAGNTGTMGLSVISLEESISPVNSQKFPIKVGGGDAFSGFIPVNPNTSYVIGAWAKAGENTYVPVGFNPYTSSHGSAGSEVWLWTNEWTIGPTWSWRSAQFTTSSNTAYIKIKSEWWLEAPGNQPAYMDNLFMRYAIASEPTLTLGEEENNNLVLPVITEILNDGPINLGSQVNITAHISTAESYIDSVTLRLISPVVIEVPMSLISGTTIDGVWGGSYTPNQGGAFSYRIRAHANNGRQTTSPLQTFQVNDNTPPVITGLTFIDPINVNNTQIVSVNVTDNGAVSSVSLSVGGTPHPMTKIGDLYSYSWKVTTIGEIPFNIIATDSANNQAQLGDTFTSQAIEVEVCTWKDCKQGAVSWSEDDSNNACRTNLEAAGLRGTFYVNGNTPQQWYTDYSAAGNEIGSHTVNHPCNGPSCPGGVCTPENIWLTPYDEQTMINFRSNEFDPNIAAIETATSTPVLSGAWPCGCTDANRMTAAQFYLLGDRGYNDCGCGWVQDNNAPTPILFMNLNGLHAYDQTFIDRAITDGTWTIVTSHGECTGIDYIGAHKDVLWTPTVGEGLKYIYVRDATQLSNYSRVGRTITFDAVHNLPTFTRQEYDGTPLLPIVFDNVVSLKVHILDTDTVLSVMVNEVSMPYQIKILGGIRYVIFDTPLNGSRHIVVNLSAPAPIIGLVTDNSPVELGQAAQVNAVVTISEGTIQNVTLQVISPVPADYPMSLSASPDTYTASFTPSTLGDYTYQVQATNDTGGSSLSPVDSLSVIDSTSPTWRSQTQTHASILVGEENSLSAEGLDIGGLEWATLETNESGVWHEFTWPISDWWNPIWPHRVQLTLTESAGLARTAETVDVQISSALFTGLASCTNELRLADTGKNELPIQIYGEESIGGILTCHLLFQAELGANQTRNYYIYYGNTAAAAPSYITDLTSSTAGNILTLSNNFLNLDLDTSSGIISRVKLPTGTNVNLPLSPQSDSYWGWHQICSSLDGNITGKSSTCIGGTNPATGLVLTTQIDGPIIKEYAFTSQKGGTTYHMTYRFFANSPYYKYDLTVTGTAANVLNNFWYINGNFSRLGIGTGGTPISAYNTYGNSSDQVRIASFDATIVPTSIDGSNNDGTSLGGVDYDHPSVSGLNLLVTTGASQADTELGLGKLAAPVVVVLGTVIEEAPETQYGSPANLNGAVVWSPASFPWQNPAIPIGTDVSWRIKFCDLSGNCATTDNMTFSVVAPLVTISGNAGVAGVTLSYTDGTPKTATADGSGNYSFTVPNGWSGTVTPSLAGFTFAPVSTTYTQIIADQTAQNYTPTAVTYVISGNAGIAGVTLSYVDGTPKTVTALGDGSYTFSVPYDWSGTVTPFLAGYGFAPTNRVYTNVLADKSGEDYTATLLPEPTVVLVNVLDPSFTAPGGGGVYSGYYTGPYDSRTIVSPGAVTLYDGRQAGIIKAGYVTAEPWDEGLFGFKPSYTINAFAAGVVSYDVENEAGVNPVWMTIEIDMGTGNRDDNPTFQSVPAAYDTGWHTVNAAAGVWQLMDADGNATGPELSLSAIAADPAYSGKPVLRAYLRLGQGLSYYNGGTHTIGWVDKVTLSGVTYDFAPATVTISGNAGIAGVTLSYVDGTPKTVTALGDGSYTFSVPYDWSGTVTPFLAGYGFAPTNRVYTNVLADKSGEDYTATLLPEPTVVLVNVLDPSFTAPGGGGVYSGYYTGPYDSRTIVSPGAVTLYDGRQAGIIKAGYVTAEPWDEGLFGFKPSYTINAFAAGVVSYDVENEAGVNPVWMTIEIDMGTGNRDDNPTFQSVPAAYDTGWHTVNAAAGVWQLMDADGNATGPELSLSAIAADPAYSGKPVLRAYLRLGQGLSYYNGGTHTIGWVDKVTLSGVTYDFAPATVTISGNAGIAGVTLSYVDGTPKTVTALGDGSYTFSVPYDWSGTVTPFLAGYGFAPTNRVYTNVLADKSGEDYTATLLPEPTVVLVNVLDPSFTAPGGGGVYSGYYTGPYDSRTIVSPGAVTLYDGRQAGIIKAGYVTAEPWDEGLFGFKPSYTINAFAAGVVSYDVENEAGVNPVWMTIEIDMGTGNRDDNPTFQSVPAAYDTGWHTVNAAAGVWQLMDADGNATGPELSLSAIAADPAYSGKPVLRAYLRLGQGLSYYNGGTHTIGWVDKVTLSGVTYDFAPATVTISGNAGVAGVTLSYVDGTPKTVTALGDGSYTFSVPYDWSGTVTPFLAGYGFAPTNRVYTNVLADKSGEDYTATLLPEPTVVLVNVLDPSFTAPGGGGVYSGYYTGPYDSRTIVSPGAVTLYDGRQAGIIKAGYVTAEPWDEGLFGFKPSYTINAFAAGVVSYDVENEAGVNPVWMTIEIDMGTGNRDDNPTFQSVPAAYDTGWHTVNAAAGVWQLMDADGNATGPELSLSAIAADPAYSGKPVLRAYLRLGQGLSYYNGGTHTIGWVDKVTLSGVTYDFAPATVTISGNAGIAGVTLSYVDGTPKTVTALGDGSYTFSVPYDWSGTVTPFLAGYGFAPTNRVYTNVLADKSGEDYTATLLPEPTVVLVNVLDPSFTAPGGGGVYSGYYTGPYDSRTIVSPGAVTLYDGRQAGIIKAGYVTAEPWDEGLFGFKPSYTINAFAAGVVSYDVENEAGVNPVWMTIEIDMGTGNRDDNPTFQSVPAAYDTGWHTVNAAAGVWQLMDADGNATGPELSLSAIAADPAYSGKPVLRAYLRLGQGLSYYNGGTHTIGWVDKVTLSGVTYDFAPATVTISGNAGIAGVTLSYVDGTPKTVTALGDGSYTFSVPYDWSGTVTPFLAGFTFAPIDRTYTNIQVDQTGQDYIAIPVTFAISGNSGIPGTILSYVDGTPKTAIADGGGSYIFSVSYNWSGTVTPSLAGFAFTPSNRTYSNVLANQTGQNYTATPTSDVILAIRPSIITVAVAQDFDLILEVRAGALSVDGAAAYLNFNTTYLQVVSITPGSTLPVVLENNFNNSTGQVNFAAGILIGDLPSGTFTLATVRFHALAETSGTPIHISVLNPRKSDITYGGFSILTGTEDSTVTITPNSSIQGSVTLQGRPTSPDPSWIEPLTVILTLPGQMDPIYSFTPTTDNSGHFTMSEITPGSYDVYVKNSHTLQNVKRVTLLPGANAVDFGTLKEGDANNDNTVTIVDFSILRTTFGLYQGIPGYDDRADFDEDDNVTILDFTLLATNFGQWGPIIASNPKNTTNTPVEPLADVLIVVNPALINVNPGDIFNVTIQIQSGSQLLDGVSAFLDFDPTKLMVNSLTGNTTAFPFVLGNTFNNTNGTIAYSAGTFSNFPSGNVDVVVIQFTALGESQSTPLAFHFVNPRNTDVTYGGGSVLTGHTDGQLQIGFFNKTAPANGAGGVSINPTLSWTTSLGVTRYEYCLSTTNACSVWNDNGTATSVALSGLNYSTPYYWHVRAINGVGTVYTDGSSTDIWSFTTQAPTDVRLADFTLVSLPQGIQLNWQSAQENDLIGFNIYRSESPDGPQVQINYELIAAITPGELQGNDYVFLDTTAEVGKIYYYWVEWVGSTDTEQFGPVTESLAPNHVWLPIGLYNH